MSEWISVDDRLPKPLQSVLIRQRTGYRQNHVTVVGKWIPGLTEESDGDVDDWHEYDEASDTFYTPQGWYENQFNWGDYSAIHISEDLVTHWMPLPEPPKEQQP